MSGEDKNLQLPGKQQLTQQMAKDEFVEMEKQAGSLNPEKLGHGLKLSVIVTGLEVGSLNEKAHCSTKPDVSVGKKWKRLAHINKAQVTKPSLQLDIRKLKERLGFEEDEVGGGVKKHQSSGTTNEVQRSTYQTISVEVGHQPYRMP